MNIINELKENTKASSKTTNIICDMLNEELKEKDLNKKYCIYNEDFLDNMKHGNKKEVINKYKTFYNKLKNESLKYGFIINSDYYKTKHTYLMVYNNVDKEINIFDTQDYVKDKEITEERNKDIKIIKEYFDSDYKVKNLSNYAPIQKDDINCVYYTLLMIRWLAFNNYNYKDNKFKSIDISDVKRFKNNVYDSLPEETKEIIKRNRLLQKKINVR